MAHLLDQITYGLLERQDWGRIGPRLAAYAAKKARAYCLVRYGRELALGTTAEDITQAVILDTISGQRHYDPNKGELLPWLYSQVRSEVDALAKSAPRRHEVPLTFGQGRDEAEEEPLERFSPPLTPSDDPGESVPASIDAKRAFDAVCELVKGDQELESMLLVLADGCDPRPRFIAEELGVPVETVYNCKRRLERLLDKAKANDNAKSQSKRRRTAASAS